MADDPAPSPSRAPAALLRRLGLQARKGLSQSFLTDEQVCRQMAEAAELSPDDEVLEIGPGLGILTAVLVERGRRVVAVELDAALAAHLPRLVPARNLEVMRRDALQLDPADHFAGPYKLVANLPYQITSPVLTRFLVERRRPAVLVIMIQLEVAARLTARPGDASYLTILAQAVAEPTLVRRVSAGAFFPRPKVESAVVRLLPRAEPAVPEPDLADFLRLARAGFTQPRKMLANSLAQGLGRPRGAIEEELVAAGVEPTARPQHLALADWVRLFDHRRQAS